MGQNKTIYLHDDVLQLTGNGDVINFGKLINDLLREHFSNSEEALQKKMDNLTRERDMVKAQLVNQREANLRKMTAIKQIKEMTQQEIQRKQEIADLKEQLKNGEITEEEYWKHFD